MHFHRNFNSIKVRLERNTDIDTANLLNYFNSIKVRLEQYGPTTKRPHYQFQFHKGTIRTLIISFLSIIEEDFNSIKVRLEQYS